MVSIFQTISRIVYGQGAISKLGDEVKRLGCKRVLIMTDKGLINAGLHNTLLAALQEADITADVFSDVELDPTPESIEKAAEVVSQVKADIIIGFGGGSALDSAKATALLAKHGGKLERFFGMHLVPSECLPTILIPTTAGTGSEMTSIAVLGDKETNSKKGIVSDYLYAKVVLLDPDLTLKLPQYYTAITGLDALVHAMESFVNTNATPFTDAPNIHAIRLISDNIRLAYTNGNNRSARAAMLYAASICGMGFSNTQNGVIHAIGMAVPANYHLPHGLLMAAIAPMGISFNAIASPEKYATIAEFLGSAPHGASTLEKALSASRGFSALLKDLNIEPGLEAHGVKREDIAGIAERAAAARRLMDGNPRQATARDLEKLITEHF
ncbi:MAG: iron-containing alcohol dehydrogenase [Desulfovibrio sp.]|uniref:iron-containing alcohol dehydrogenase n=1 Tax=Desulfovibrio sp. TaxID=885 RepID=UPI002A3672BB|nr:iron-containing alcohol dehydrogenase [Desulfovibrio sp.]MDY0260625.1 iron-containing alcohol dehydrogenase [Desulfovibrio sp.]